MSDPGALLSVVQNHLSGLPWWQAILVLVLVQLLGFGQRMLRDVWFARQTRAVRRDLREVWELDARARRSWLPSRKGSDLDRE